MPEIFTLKTKDCRALSSAQLREVAESFGYQEYDAPIIEPIELYVSKTSDEIVSEQTYNFLDRGGRHVTLRPEMTPSVSRMVAAAVKN